MSVEAAFITSLYSSAYMADMAKLQVLLLHFCGHENMVSRICSNIVCMSFGDLDVCFEAFRKFEEYTG